MSGPFGSSQWMYSSGGFYPTEIEQSLRFNNNDTAYLSKTFASAGNRKTWTFSAWVKRGVISDESFIFAADTSAGSSSRDGFRFESTDELRFFLGGAVSADIKTNAKYRDASAWYHIVIALDTTQVTASDRFSLYVNGEQVTSLATSSYPAQDLVSDFNNAAIHRIGLDLQNTNNPYDGYMAEVNFIDGQALDPTDFGEFKSGVWVAKEYTGSYGTNGFYLNFSDSAAIGDDLSGNANDWTANNLVATDVVLDSPTNNFCTLNPVDKRSGSNVDEANLFIGPVSGNHYWARGTIKIPNDQKIYLEALAGDNGSGSIVAFFGIIEENSNLDSGGMDNGVACNSADFYKHVDGAGSSQGSSVLTAGDIVGLAFDMPNSTMTIYKNGSVTTNAVSFTPGEFYLYLSIFYNFGGTPSWVLNAGQDSSFGGRKTRQGNTDENGIGDFYYAPPSGYLTLCTANLTSPTIDPAKNDVPADYFNTVLYTGNGSTQSITVGFQPDLVWGKDRGISSAHRLFDAVRGATKQIHSNLTDAETTDANSLTSFNSDGFSVGSSTAMNYNTEPFVTWNWLAGNGTSSNTDGSITSTVSVNQKAGFSVVSYTGTAASATVGHGLGQKPAMLIVKKRTDASPGGARGWAVWHQSLATDKVLELNTNAAELTEANFFIEGNINTTTFGVGADYNTGWTDDYIAYCFAEIPSYSAFGSYTGNGSTDGPFLHLDFEPSFFLAKRIDGVENWFMIDNARHPYNDGNIPRLLPNTSDAEAEDASIAGDFLSNGFKIRATQNMINTSGANYIYMAFASNPFKYANAR